MVTSTVLDAFIEKTPKFDNWMILIIFLFSLILIVIVSVSFSRIYLSSSEQNSQEFVNLNIISLISTLIFAVLLKTVTKYLKIKPDILNP
jgi:hypothetical protein